MPLDYHLLSLASGAAILALLVALLAEEPLPTHGLAPILLVVALFGKWALYARTGQGDRPSSTIQTATGLSRAAVPLLDLGHTADTFTTRELDYRATPQTRRQARLAVFGGLAAGTLLMVAPGLQSNALWVTFAVALVMMRIFTERWLFFVEAEQVVVLYHEVKINHRSAKDPLGQPSVVPIRVQKKAFDSAQRATS